MRSYKKRVELTPSETEGHLTLISFLITAGRTSDALNEAEVMMRSDSVDLEQKIDLFLSLGEDSITFRTTFSDSTSLRSSYSRWLPIISGCVSSMWTKACV